MSPNQNYDLELPLTAGDYLYVYGEMDDDGFYHGQLLTGQSGMIPSNFIEMVDGMYELQPYPLCPVPIPCVPFPFLPPIPGDSGHVVLWLCCRRGQLPHPTETAKTRRVQSAGH